MCLREQYEGVMRTGSVLLGEHEPQFTENAPLRSLIPTNSITLRMQLDHLKRMQRRRIPYARL
jgi:hypothetical protein